jgi:hypothetical protein
MFRPGTHGSLFNNNFDNSCIGLLSCPSSIKILRSRDTSESRDRMSNRIFRVGTDLAPSSTMKAKRPPRGVETTEADTSVFDFTNELGSTQMSSPMVVTDGQDEEIHTMEPIPSSTVPASSRTGQSSYPSRSSPSFAPGPLITPSPGASSLTANSQYNQPIHHNPTNNFAAVPIQQTNCGNNQVSSSSRTGQESLASQSPFLLSHLVPSSLPDRSPPHSLLALNTINLSITIQPTITPQSRYNEQIS